MILIVAFFTWRMDFVMLGPGSFQSYLRPGTLGPAGPVTFHLPPDSEFSGDWSSGGLAEEPVGTPGIDV